MIRIGDKVRVIPESSMRFAGRVGVVTGIDQLNELYLKVTFENGVTMRFAPEEVTKEGE